MTSGLRERKKLGTRRALAEAALDLAIQHGFHGFTIADITDAVGVSRRTFSNYFAGRAECLVAVTDDWLDEVLEAVTHAPAGAALAEVLESALVRFSETVADGFDQYCAVLAVEAEVQAAAVAADAAQLEVIAAAIAGRVGVAATDIRCTLLAGYAMSAGRLCLERWVAEGRSGGAAGLIHQLRQAFSIIDLSALQPPADTPH